MDMKNFSPYNRANTGFFINRSTTATPDWVRLCTLTELAIDYGAETETYSFICLENDVEMTKGYAPSVTLELKKLKNNVGVMFLEKKAMLALSSVKDFTVPCLIAYETMSEISPSKNVAIHFQNANLTFETDSVSETSLTGKIALSTGVVGTANFKEYVATQGSTPIQFVANPTQPTEENKDTYKF